MILGFYLEFQDLTSMRKYLGKPGHNAGAGFFRQLWRYIWEVKYNQQVWETE